MTGNTRDYFISYNSADAAFADAINTALRDAGYETHYAGTDLPDGANIPIWMDRTLARSTQVLALCSPDYFKPEAKYSEVERAAAFWNDPDGAKARLVPVQIADCDFTPLYAPLKRIDIRGKTADAAAAALMAHLAGVEEAQRREALRAANAHPEIFRVLRPRLTEFTGHERDLTKIHEALSQGQNAAVTQAIAGLGGIGKTTLAAEYAHRFGTKGRYGGVWWINAETSALNDLAELGKAAGLEEKQNLPEAAREALAWVGAQPTPWLMIYDNVPNPDAVRDWLPAGSARVLITSRYEDFAGLAETTRLDEWDADTTTAYLLEQTGRDDEAGAKALADKLDGLPLAAD